MKKNGFTLIELLAVIVILAVVMAIAARSVLGVMSNSKKSSLNDSANILIIYLNWLILAIDLFTA